ncbi:hypothetical protein R3P38DRAFT_2593661 [Favolaschia claudopus]|uniref:F-box domain-containing protein n=1 Tax=Favolaschia claudopus TaxID=2862362 RepID=A0AAW0EG91_9AGAR
MGVISSKPLCCVNDLPYELLSYIFHLARLEDPDRYGVPLLLARVCSHWRRTALNTPWLWVEQEFPFPEKNPEMPLNILFLEHSAPLPIRVRFVNIHHPFSNLLLHTPHQWKSLVVMYDHVYAQTVRVFLAGIPPRKLATLENFEFRCYDSTTEQSANISVLSCLPLTPWAQLTHLDLSGVFAQDCINILGRSEKLVSAAFYTPPWLETEVQSTSVLEYMEKLKLCLQITPEFKGFDPWLRRFTFPALKSIYLSHYIDEDYEWPIVPDIIPFLSRTPTLEYLHLVNYVSSEDIRQILHHTPHLTELYLRLWDNEGELEDFFQALCYEPGIRVPLAPQLQSLCLEEVNTNFDDRFLAKMIRSRWWADSQFVEMDRPMPVARWKRVDIDFSWLQSYSKAFDHEMEVYQSQGLEILYSSADA